jgi:tetratricopeptide (TPR) repeat protein
MKKLKISAAILIAIVLIASCNKKIIPGIKAGGEYDLSAFNYLYVDAVRLKLTGNLGEALKYFEQCLILNPESDATYYQIAQILLSNGDTNNGKKYLLKARELRPDNLWYNMMLANIYHQQNNLDSAIICYELAVKMNPAKEDLQISLAKLYSISRNYDKARSILERLDEKYGVNENTTISLVENLMAEGKFTEARIKVEQLLSQDSNDIVYNGYLAAIYRKEGKMEQAKAVYDQLIGRNPENPAIQLALCEFLLSEENYDELFDLLDVVLTNKRIQKEEKVSLVAELIDDKNILGRYVEEMERAIMLLETEYNEDHLIMLLRPEFLQKGRNLDKAVTILEKIIKDTPDNYYAWEKLLLVYYEMKDFLNLQKRGEECSTRFNRSIISKMLYATGALENENYSVALEELRKADILAGDSQDIKLQIVTMRADIHYRMKNFNDAFKAYDEALAMNNNDLTIMNNYAYYLAEQNMKLKQAEEMARTVIEREKENNTFLDTYAWVLYKRGKVREAARIMERIINTEDEIDAEYFEHYGFILKKLGKCSEAIKNFEKAISIDKTKANLKEEIENCRK